MSQTLPALTIFTIKPVATPTSPGQPRQCRWPTHSFAPQTTGISAWRIAESAGGGTWKLPGEHEHIKLNSPLKIDESSATAVSAVQISRDVSPYSWLTVSWHSFFNALLVPQVAIECTRRRTWHGIMIPATGRASTTRRPCFFGAGVERPDGSRYLLAPQPTG